MARISMGFFSTASILAFFDMGSLLSVVWGLGTYGGIGSILTTSAVSLSSLFGDMTHAMRTKN